jgi:ABC-type branched-subunit amino acid transport system ATPase component
VSKLKITIEGEQGSGKSITARTIAKALNKASVSVTVRDGEDVEKFPTKHPVREVVIETRQG